VAGVAAASPYAPATPPHWTATGAPLRAWHGLAPRQDASRCAKVAPRRAGMRRPQTRAGAPVAQLIRHRRSPLVSIARQGQTGRGPGRELYAPGIGSPLDYRSGRRPQAPATRWPRVLCRRAQRGGQVVFRHGLSPGRVSRVGFDLRWRAGVARKFKPPPGRPALQARVVTIVPRRILLVRPR